MRSTADNLKHSRTGLPAFVKVCFVNAIVSFIIVFVNNKIKRAERKFAGKALGVVCIEWSCGFVLEIRRTGIKDFRKAESGIM